MELPHFLRNYHMVVTKSVNASNAGSIPIARLKFCVQDRKFRLTEHSITPHVYKPTGINILKSTLFQPNVLKNRTEPFDFILYS
jgi:hypothetical protein